MPDPDHFPLRRMGSAWTIPVDRPPKNVDNVQGGADEKARKISKGIQD